MRCTAAAERIELAPDGARWHSRHMHYCSTRLAILGLAFFALAACGDSSTPATDAGRADAAVIDGGDIDGGSTGRVPLEHRADAVECDHARGPGNGDPTLTSADCTVDGDCTTGNNGRCVQSFGGALTNYCTYDACFLDSECGATQLCRCRESAIDANECVGGDCIVDSDCAGGYCSPSRGFDRINLPASAYWCHRADDECVDDSDCRVDAGPDARCVWYPARMHWACSTMGFFPP
jgi:hypothetical protein